MRKLPHSKTLLTLLVSSVFSSYAWGQPPENAVHPRLSTAKTSIQKSEPQSTSLGLGIGTGTYPILELPMIFGSSARVDGQTAEEDLRVTSGVLLHLNLNWSHNPALAPNRLPLEIELGAQRMSTAPVSGLSTPSTYLRLNSTAQLKLRSESMGMIFIPGLEARRSMYRNLESGHYVDALFVKAGLGLDLSQTVDLTIQGAFAPVTRFGLIQPTSSGKSGALENTKATVFDLATNIAWNPEPDTAFFAGFAHENTIVSLVDSSGYRAFGLPIVDQEFGDVQKQYNLSVNQWTIGTTKRF